MTHRARIGTLCIDCQTDDLGPELAFWPAALGETGELTEGGRYAQLAGYTGYPKVILQAVDHAPRVHLDIETDAIEAERARLAALGAEEVARIKDWIVMQAPTGHRFCLIPPEGNDFAGQAKEFD